LAPWKKDPHNCHEIFEETWTHGGIYFVYVSNSAISRIIKFTDFIAIGLGLIDI
jgi:hypothetical protein